ncbi:MAG: cysteine desulfurase CsdA [Flavobacteriaceae bacterium]|jgi:cysteine desulfurase/selenocysteine lyase|nr:cysteine desulfurase CsdA [Flavobacteriaceae bacterium]MBQ21864.1 cysteine desulfurase CsdA [Flavobacteriales bacterium]|tara:strand:+ start:2122 stop:3336 length:1215 start_codon:yes stop_codon:yes gene_type:complete
MIDVKKIRDDFPILKRKINGNQLIYFDNAATSQTPQVVIDEISNYYSNYNSNIHRGVHMLSQEATESYEKSRQIIQNQFNAKSSNEIIFTSGSTHGINIVASGYSNFLKKGDEIILSEMEHHSNIVPWQMLCEKTGAIIRIAKMDENGVLILDYFKSICSNKTKLVLVSHVSNALGTINPIESIISIAHSNNAVVLIDGAQAAPHIKIDLQKLDVDFYVVSGHKLMGPTGIGVLYGKESLLDMLPPYQGGGEMIEEVTFSKTTYAKLPHKFEAGTPNISGGIALGTAISYLNEIGFDSISKYEKSLLDYATFKLLEIDGLKIYGESNQKTAVISFNIESIHPYDLGTILDKLGIAVRTGHHCAQPIMDHFNIPGTIRASFSFYNTKEEIDIMVEAIKRAKLMLA